MMPAQRAETNGAPAHGFDPTGEALQKRKELTESLHERNYFTQGTESRKRLTEVVDQTIYECSDEMVIEIHREYFHSPITGKRIHTGVKEELPAAQIHEMAVLTKCLPQAENKTLIEHIKAFNTYSQSGLIESDNYALESEKIKSQCSALLTVAYNLHKIDYRMLTWVETHHSKKRETCPRIKDKNLIAYILENPEHSLLVIRTIEERGREFDLDLLRHMGTTASSLSEGTL
jgi:hypothetical protein